MSTASATLCPTLPIFPLCGVLLLPRGTLPLNIFEARYISMVDDVLAGDRVIGMVQPMEARSRAAAPEIYPIGCAGRISSFEETDDGRYLIALTGFSRFVISEELSDTNGYRRVRVDWSDYRDDLTAEGCGSFDRERLLTGLVDYFSKHALSANWDAIRATPDERLVNTLAMICPFEPSEKQALLEAKTLAARAELMITLIEMCVLTTPTPDQARH